MRLLIALVIAVVAVALGWGLQDQPYRLSMPQFGPQAALDHRDSPYSSITWAVSESDNYQQLRFFDRVEGGICLRPGWQDLITLAGKQPTLAHLVPNGERPQQAPAGKSWPYPWQPDPGTLTNSAYIRLFPVGVLLNRQLMTAAGGDFRKTTPRVLVVGLGSGIGIANLAYHFPQAAITVVDIDQVVVDMVRAHFPLLRWLSEQKLADGSPRLRFMVRDARQFIRYDAKREAKPYDLVILDAYTSGSTIPPHLMTQEFFTQCAAIVGDNGIVMANVIGSYLGDKRRISGGAIRTFQAAGLAHVWNFPVLSKNEGANIPGGFDRQRTRNNIVVCAKTPIDPRGNSAGWDALRDFAPYPELALATYRSGGYVFIQPDGNHVTGSIPTDIIDAAVPGLRSKLSAQNAPGNSIQNPQMSRSEDRVLIDQALQAANAAIAKGVLPLPYGWKTSSAASAVTLIETDWVAAARETFRLSVLIARDENNSGEALTGPPEGKERDAIRKPNWIIADAPLFTDQMPNADIFND